MIKRLTHWTMLASVLAALTACSGNSTDDLDAWMLQAGQGLAGHVEPLPQVKPYEPMLYNADNLPAPFNKQKLLQARRQASPNAPDFNRPREPLENFELDKLHMVGTLKRGGITYALVRTPDNTILRVQAGNFMGANFGQIVKITETEIQLSETVEDLNGAWVPHITTVQLEEQGQK